MRTSQLIGRMLLAFSFLLTFAWALSAGAAEQQGTAGPAPATDVAAIGGDKQSAPSTETVIVTEPTVKPQPITKMPEWLRIPAEDDYSHLLNLDFHGQDQGIVVRTREEDSKHAVSF